MNETDIRLLLGASYPRLVGAVALVTNDVAAAEDAVQEAIVRAWERSERGDRIESLDRWVAAVAMNLSRSWLRRRRVERLARPRLAASSTVDEPSVDATEVRRALAALPRRQREAVVLRYYLDLGIEDIATAMHTSAGTVKSQLAKAREHLARSLDAHEGDEERNHADV